MILIELRTSSVEKCGTSRLVSRRIPTSSSVIGEMKKKKKWWCVPKKLTFGRDLFYKTIADEPVVTLSEPTPAKVSSGPVTWFEELNIDGMIDDLYTALGKHLTN